MERPAAPFPPSPWHLTGDMIVSLWRVPPGDLPSWPLPPGVRPWVVRRRATLATFWVDYRPGGALAYREFLIALAVRHGHRLAAGTVAAWVDDEQSLAGGRALWGIPKELGTITFRADGRNARVELTTAGTPPVRLTYRDVLRLPFRLPAHGHLIQQLSDGTVCRVPMRISGRPALGRSRVTAAGEAPLSVLTRHRPLLTVALRDFRSTVGGSAPSADH
ncbi:acetoacetate decarboxylase family protein [Streptomyces sp. NPDC093598]|uniref:acetoacetate decarboxylase family protein n=1 Tax=Streptomyces sp. NPDC093598 TaxID=3366046 RepID=UPI00381C63C0